MLVDASDPDEGVHEPRPGSQDQARGAACPAYGYSRSNSGLGIRLGADAALTLIPGVGDVAGSLIGLFIVNEARRLGLPPHKLAAMLVNLGLDTACGLFPVIGDISSNPTAAMRQSFWNTST